MAPATSPARSGAPAARTELAAIVAVIDDRSPQGIAAAISRLVSSHDLETGTRLPTVRDLAAALGTSATTVSGAWQALAALGVIESRGRLGTFVLAQPAGTQRYSRMSGERPATFRLDLATGTPDPALLPDLGPALRRIGRRAHVSNYHDEHVLPALEQRLRASWPYEPDALVVVDGALDALDRLTTQLVRFGDRVLVENPTFPAFLDLLDIRGADAVAVATDQYGPLPESLEQGLERDPVAFFLQTRAQNPTGASLTPQRVRALAARLRGTGVVIVEDDHSGEIGAAPDLSLGTYLPDQTVHVRSYSKSHGPDLRIAAVAGPAAIVGPVSRRRHLGPGWSSRLLQGLLVDLLDDPSADEVVARARDVYETRRRDLRAALAARGVTSSPGSGVNLWVEVADEHAALITLAAAGIRASPGSPFLAAPLPGRHHIRITCGVLAAGGEDVADHIAAAALPLGVVPLPTAAARRRPHAETASR